MNTQQTWRIGDCVELMREMPDESVDLVIADPPYYRIDSSSWDRQWKTLDAYLDWLDGVAVEIKRVLKPNGSLYVFGDDQRIAYVQVRLDKHFSFLNHLIWYKRNNQSIKGAMSSRRYACVSERILFYEQESEAGLPATGLQEIHSTKDCFTSVKEYVRGESNTRSIVTHHYFADSQYCFQTLEPKPQFVFTGFFWREYEDLRQKYEDLRRPFHPHKQMYEVFDIPIIDGGDNTSHPTQKPAKLIERLIRNSSNECDTVLDPFLGSGTTLEACRRTNRNCIGFEIDPQWGYLYPDRCMSHTPPLTSYFGGDE